MPNNSSLVIIGAGGHARPVIDTAQQLNINLLGIIDIAYTGVKELIFDTPIIGNFNKLSTFSPLETDVFVAIGDGEKREEIAAAAQEMNFKIPTLIHPTAIVSKHASIANGCFINAGAIINAQVSIKEGSIINTGVIIDHEVAIGKYCHIAPGTKIAGRVHIGSNAFIGIGCVIADKLNIGSNAVLGAGSVVVNDIEPSITAAGVPAKKIK